MPVIKQGRASLEVPDEVEPPEKAGKLTAQEKKRVPKARPGLGVACAAAANGIRVAGNEFEAPRGITPELLEFLGERAESIDLVIKDIEALLEIFKQTNLLFDAEALAALGKVNKRVNETRSEKVRNVFSAVTAYYGQPKRTRKHG